MVAMEGSAAADAQSVFRSPLKHARRQVRQGLVGHVLHAGTACAIKCRIAVRYVFVYRPELQR